MNKYKKLLIFLPIALLTLVAGFFYFNGRSKTAAIPNQKVQELKADLTIKNGDRVQNFDISQYIGKTALEATRGVAKTLTSGSGENAFVTTINGKNANSKKHEFWELIINGKSAPVGAGSYTIQNGDKLEWQLSLY